MGRLWLSLQSHATDPRPKLKNWVHWDSNPCPLRQGILNPAHQPTRPGRLIGIYSKKLTLYEMRKTTVLMQIWNVIRLYS